MIAQPELIGADIDNFTELDPRPHLSLVPSVDEPVAEDEPADEPLIIAPQNTVTLRRYQRECVKSVRYQWHPKNEYRVRATLAVLATGTGKTVIMAEIARRAIDEGHSVLWLAHRDELIRQGAKALGRMGIHGLIEKAQERALPQFGVLGNCVVASVQTLQRDRLEQWDPDAFSLIIIDEAHHTPATSYGNIVKYFSKARIVGFTATADRLDGKNVGRVYESLAYEYTLRHAITDPEGPWLVPLEVVPIQTDPPIDLKNIKISLGDLNSAELEKKLVENMDNIVNESKPVIAGRRTIAFTPDIYSAYSMAESFKQVGVNAVYLASKDIHGKPISIAARNEVKRRFENGLYDLVVNPMIWTEGVDIPSADCVLIGRPTRSRSLYSQMVGRITRPFDGKERGRIVDLACIGHELISAVDLFDDSQHSDEVVKAAREMVERGEQTDPLLALEYAEELHAIELQRRVQITERQARTAYRAYDPVGAMELIGIKRKATDTSWFDTKPANDRQKKRLNGLLNKKRQVLNVDDLSYYEAANMLRKLQSRIDKGLASVGQIALLVARGMPQHQAEQVRFDEVNAALEQLNGNRGA